MKKSMPIESLRKQLNTLVIARIVEGKTDPKIAERYTQTVAEIAKRTKQTPKRVRTQARRHVRSLELN
jgi:hypothetical protein